MGRQGGSVRRGRKRLKPPRELSLAEREELDALIADQRADDKAWITPPRKAVSLDALLGAGEDGEVTLKDLMIEEPDYSPFGFMRRLMELNVENTKAAARTRRRSTGWRVTNRKKRTA